MLERWGLGWWGWEREIESKGLPVWRGEIGQKKKKTREMCKKGDKKKWKNDRGEAGIRYLNEHMRKRKREREGGRERQ